MRPLFVVPAIVAGAIVVVSAAAITLPDPTGPAHIGTRRWLVTDDTRSDRFDGGSKRQIEVIAWYPTDVSPRALAPYLREGIASVRSFATILGNANVLDELATVHTHATADAPAAKALQQFPLLLFSHGYTAVPAGYTSLLEDLASRGYVVLSIVHPFEASASTLDGGRVVSMLDDGGRWREPIRKVFEEWRQEDARMADVTAATARSEQLRLLKDYLSGLHNTHIALKRWVDDTKAVVARLPLSTSAGADLLRRIDFKTFGVLGHSMGGVTAAEYCLTEPRCRAVLNLDGIPQYGSMIETRLNRPLLMVYSARTGRLGASDAIYEQSARPYYRVAVSDTLHLDFSDMAFWPELRRRRAIGARPEQSTSEITREIVREFFDQELRRRPSPLLSGKRVLPGVAVTRYN